MNWSPDAGISAGQILLRALLYAAAITLLVLCVPDEAPKFIYMGF